MVQQVQVRLGFSWGSRALMLVVLGPLQFPCPAPAQRVITTIVGTEWSFPATPIAGADAPLGIVTDMEFDAKGNLFFVDQSNHMVMKMAPDGTITVVAGNGFSDNTGDGGPAIRAALTPYALTLDKLGNIYVSCNTYIRKITPDGIIRSIAGTGVQGSVDSGVAAQSAINVRRIALDAQGNIYFTHMDASKIRRISTDGTLSTYPQYLFLADDLAFDAQGNLLISTYYTGLQKVSPDGTQSLIDMMNRSNAGPFAIGADGQIYVATCTVGFSFQYAGAESYDPGGRLAGALAPDPLQAGCATAVTTASDGSVYFALAGRIYKGRIASSTPPSVASPIAGNGLYRHSPDGIKATSTVLNGLTGLASNGGGLVFSERLSNVVRRLDSNGTVETLAGGGECPPQINIPFGGTTALCHPTDLAFGPAQALLILDAGDLRVVQVGANRQLQTLYFDLGVLTDGGLFNMAVDPAGTIYATEGTRLIRLISDPNPVIAKEVVVRNIGLSTAMAAGPKGDLLVTIGSGISKYGGYCPLFVCPPLPGIAKLRSLSALTTDQDGNIYAGGLGIVYQIAPDGTVTTVAGTGQTGNSGDGDMATKAQFGKITGLALDAAGNLYLADNTNNRIREVLAQPPLIGVDQAKLEFAASSKGAPAAAQQLVVTASVTGLPFSVVANAPWLSASVSDASTPRRVDVVADPGSLDPGAYSATITIQAPLASPSSLKVQVTFQVSDRRQPTLQLDKDHLTFTFPKTGSQRQQTLLATNVGSGSLAVSIRTSTQSGGAWLSAAPASASISPGNPVTFSIGADPRGLGPGAYRGSIAFDRPGGIAIPVTMTISDRDHAISLTQSGLSFTAVSGGGVVPPQAFGVLNVGTGVMRWTAASSGLTGGTNWLVLGATQGASDAAAAQVPTVQASVDPNGLAPGRYTGLIRVESVDAANSPQLITVFLEVLAPGQNPGAALQPAELLFTDAPNNNASRPGSQEFVVYNLAQRPVSFRSSSTSLTLLPSEATVAPNQPRHIVVQQERSFGAGAREEDISLQFDDGFTRTLRVIFQSAGSAVGPHAETRAAASDACKASTLTPAVETIGIAPVSPAGWPAAIAVNVADNCGNALRTGSVVVTFSNGDAPLSMLSLNDGHWQGTWQNRNADVSAVTLKIDADDPQTGLHGSREFLAGTRTPQAEPVISSASVVSAAGSGSYTPLAPGSILSIYGQRLTAGSTEFAAVNPLPDHLAGSYVLMAGSLMPLIYASESQINAIVPSGVSINTSQQVLVARADTYSTPVPVDLAAAQPAFFNVRGYAIAQAFRGDRTFVVSVSEPAQAGDSITLYCAGLGLVDPPIQDGTLTPSSPPSQTRSQVTLAIGGKDAAVSFAGLTPGFVGLYQVNAIVPRDVTPGDSVPLTITVAGQASPAAFLTIR